MHDNVFCLALVALTLKIMRTKSINPKRAFLNVSENKDENTDDENEVAMPLSKDQNCPRQSEGLVKSEMNNNIHFNGSPDVGKVAQNDGANTQVFTFKLLPATVLHATKCSCFVMKKDQSTQTTSDAQECSQTSLAVNNTSTTSSGLPSPSWSQSSDSEGSLPRTPNKTAKSYNCSVCTKPFPTPSKLRRHFLIHSGEKPYSCSVCSKPFNDPANLKRHHWSHIKEKPFICSECQGEFMTKRDAMMHLCPAIKRRRK